MKALIRSSFAVALAWLLVPVWAEEAQSASWRILTFDALASQGGTLRLSVKLVVPAGAREGLEAAANTQAGNRVDFWLDEEHVGSKLTRSDGRSEHFVRADGPGRFSWRARVHGAEGWVVEAAGRAFVWAKDSGVIVSDIDDTLSLSPKPYEKLVATPNEQIHALPGAPKALRKLAKKFRIVYVTGRDESMLNRTRDWLSLRGFPPGPLIIRDSDALFQWKAFERYKTRVISSVRKKFPKTLLGVGDLSADIRAYHGAGIHGIHIGPDVPEDLPEGAAHFSSWREIEPYIKAKAPSILERLTSTAVR